MILSHQLWLLIRQSKFDLPCTGESSFSPQFHPKMCFHQKSASIEMTSCVIPPSPIATINTHQKRSTPWIKMHKWIFVSVACLMLIVASWCKRTDYHVGESNPQRCIKKEIASSKSSNINQSWNIIFDYGHIKRSLNRWIHSPMRYLTHFVSSSFRKWCRA